MKCGLFSRWSMLERVQQKGLPKQWTKDTGTDRENQQDICSID
jgi:hypothetical protein